MEMVSGSRPASDEGSMRLSMARSYGNFAGAVEGQLRLFVHMLVLNLVLLTAGTAFAQTPAAHVTKTIKVVVLVGSLSAGLGLPGPAAFSARWPKALHAQG